MGDAGAEVAESCRAWQDSATMPVPKAHTSDGLIGVGFVRDAHSSSRGLPEGIHDPG